ncbi:MAG: TetR/AcrR family transcriptional regulator [Actinomycetota bacterium]
MSSRYDDRPRTRRPGAGRPRNTPRSMEGPVDAEIVAAAARRFAKHGVNGTTMADIAEDVGLGVSSLYYYFRNKHAVLERIVVEVNEAPLRIITDVRASFADPAEQLYAFIVRDAIALCEFPFDINEIHRLAGEDPDTFDRYWTDRRRLQTDVQRVIDEGVASQVFRPVDSALMALTVLANDEAVQNWYRPPAVRARPGVNQSLSPEAIGRHLAELTLRGLLRNPENTPGGRLDPAAPGGT